MHLLLFQLSAAAAGFFPLILFLRQKFAFERLQWYWAQFWCLIDFFSWP